MQAWLTAICCCSLFMARLGCHSSAGSDILQGKSCQYAQRSEGTEATTHNSVVHVGVRKSFINACRFRERAD